MHLDEHNYICSLFFNSHRMLLYSFLIRTR